MQVPETLPEEVLSKMHAPPKKDVPLANVDDLPNADGFLLATPTVCSTRQLACSTSKAALTF